MKAEKRKKILIYIGLTFLAVLMIIPFYWMLISSVKLNKDVFSIPMEWIPRSFPSHLTRHKCNTCGEK